MEVLTRLATLRMTSSSGWAGRAGAEWTLLPDEVAVATGVADIAGGGMGAVPAALMAAAMRRSAMTEAGVASMPLGLSRYDMV